MHTNSSLLTTSEFRTDQPIENQMEKESDGVEQANGVVVEVEAAKSSAPILCANIQPAEFQDKKDVFWLNGVVDCFSTILSVFGREDDKTTIDSSWEVSSESITEMVYIGSGAQGIVFKGMFRGEEVAVKKLREQTESNFKHLRKLNHENIVRFKGVSSQPPFYCVIMEYCQYGPLFNLLHNGVIFSPKQILKWAKEIAQGMAYLHSHKIVHRDLKSPNILLGDDMIVKVSDFGTSRVWNDVSALMSFTGTVAWMAPEVIRHELCCDKVDVWSFGVVLWELLTQEIPYKTLETHAIMWGVGTNALSLPVPPSFPESLQLLMKQCWNRVPRYRPSFKFIASHLDLAGQDLTCLHFTQFDATQAVWRKDVVESLHECRSEEGGGSGGGGISESAHARQRREDARCVRDLRRMYEQQVSRANEVYLKACAVQLNLEQRERVLAQREKALNSCRCGVAFGKKMKQVHRTSSSSSDNAKVPLACLKQSLPEARLQRTIKNRQANRQDRQDKHATHITHCQKCHPLKIDNKHCNEIISDAQESCKPIPNNNINALTILEKKDTIIECNGNVEVVNTRQTESALLHHLNGNDIVKEQSF